MNSTCVKIANAFHTCSRLTIIILGCLSAVHWTSVTLVIHFLVMLGWIVEQMMTMNKNEALQWFQCLKLAVTYCFFFYYIRPSIFQFCCMSVIAFSLLYDWRRRMDIWNGGDGFFTLSLASKT